MAINNKRTWSWEVLALDHCFTSIIAGMACGTVQSVAVRGMWHRLFIPCWTRRQKAGRDPET